LTQFARHLSLVEHGLFSAILLREFLNVSWAHSSQREVLAPRLTAMIRHSNRLTGSCHYCAFRCLLRSPPPAAAWIVSSIVALGTPRARARQLERYIAVGKVLLGHANFNGVMEVVSSLNTATVSRLRRSWEVA
jgi:hypothetical protein